MKTYLDKGLILQKVHRVVEFHEEAWAKTFINHTNDMRKEAKMKGDKSGESVFKLYNNAIFGKACENVEEHVNIELIQDGKILKKRIAKPNFNRSKIFRENLVGVDMLKSKVILDRPMQVGFAVLEISKCLMYDFHYEKWMPRFPNSKLIFTDTDSLCYLTDKDPYHEMKDSNFCSEFDFSQYPKDHDLYNSTNLKCLGKMKDE